LDEVGYRYDLQQATAAHDVPGSVNSILSEHHDQSGKRNGNQENRPIHNIKAKEPRHRLSILIVKHMRSLAFGSTTVSEAL
jgi:hypothetical protein